MKRFVISILFASLFFLGIGSLIEQAGAKFRSDEKALALIASARQAIGGDANLREVRSMTIVGSTTNFYEKDGVPATQLGGTEINFEFPGRFSKTVKIGDPGDHAAAGEMKKRVEVMVFERKGSGEASAVEIPKGEKEVFVVRKDDGNVEWTSDENADLTSDGHKIVIRKNDGTVTEFPADGDHNVEIDEQVGGEASVWNTEDGRKIVLEKTGPHIAHRSSGGEMLRTTMALLMSAPEGTDVSYKFIGEGDVDGYPANVIEVSSPQASFKLFLDASTNLPRMISYAGHSTFVFRRHGNEEVSKAEVVELKRQTGQTVEHQIRFSDFRTVDGLVLPHRWTESVSGKQSMIFDVTSYEINPANIAEKFGDTKVFVRKGKPQGN